MIAYLEGKDVTVEVPDDIGDGDLADIQKNFEAYVQPETPEAAAPTVESGAEDVSGPEMAASTTPDGWQTNFYESFVRPNLPALTGPAGLALQAGETSERRAFTGKMAEGLTFGATKSIAPDVLAEDYKQHPVYAAAGELAGGVGSLSAAGAMLRATKLASVAVKAGTAATPYLASAPRFIPRAIMSGSTFGTHTFVREAIKALQQGNVDPAEFGESVIKNTALGALLGTASGLYGRTTATASAAGLGFLSAKSDGADDTEALLNAAIWGTFELVGSIRRKPELTKQAFDTLGDSIGEYVAAKEPRLSPDQARAAGAAIVRQAAQRVGGMEAVIKGENGADLKAIEQINQQVRLGKVKEPAPEQVKLTNAGESGATAAPVPGEPATTPAPAPPKAVKVDADGIPKRGPRAVVAVVQDPDGRPVKITHQMVLDEAEGLAATQNADIEAKSEKNDPLVQFVLDNGGIRGFKGGAESEEFKGVPVRFRGLRAADEMAQNAFDAGLLPEPSADMLRKHLEGIKGAGARARVADFYDEAKRALEEFFSTTLPGEIPTEVEPGVFFDSADLISAPKENIADRYERLRQEALAQGLNPAQAAKFAKDKLKGSPASIEPAGAKPKQEEFSTGDGVTGFGTGREGEPDLFFDRPEPGAAAPTFFSAVERTITEKMPAKAPAQQIMGLLKNTPGVKQEELDVLGLPEFLESQQGSITKETVLEFVKQGGVQIQEVTKGGSAVSERKESESELNRIQDRLRTAGFEISLDPGAMPGDAPILKRLTTGEELTEEDFPSHLGDDAMRWAELADYLADETKRAPGETKFDNYTLPGGENYRELLFTLPAGTTPNAARVAEYQRQADELIARREAIADSNDPEWKRLDEELGDVQRLKGNYQRMHEADLEKKQFRSSHFSEPNILAHVRFNERTDAEGKRVLFIEEVQSDWHQKGREHGYNTSDLDRRFNELKTEYAAVNEKMAQAVSGDINEYKDLERRHGELLDEMNEIHDARSAAVPDAPFKKTWHELTLKRMIRYAAENGFDRIAWTTGEQQAERYDLSNQVDTLSYKKNEEGNYQINAILKDRGGVENLGSHPAQALPDIVGKEMAQKIIAGEGESSGPGDTWRRFSGLDLKVGGAGMKGFYDQIIPSFLNKYTKKWGGRVGTMNVSTNPPFTIEKKPEGWVVTRTDGERVFGSEVAARSYAEGIHEKIPAHALDITPSMKEAVLEVGQPLFDKPGPSSSKGAYGREFGDEKDRIASIHKSIGGMEYVKKLKGPELVKLAESISGKRPVAQKILRALGFFQPGTEKIALDLQLFKDQRLWEAVLAHELGHLMDFNDDKTMSRGNILGRIASLKSYRKSLLPEAPDSTEQILTQEDRARFRAEAERIAKGQGEEKKDEPDNQFNPQAVLDVWNSISKNVDQDLLSYIKGLDVDQKKSLIKAAMQALKNGEQITIYDVRKFNKSAEKDFKRVADIYKDLVKAEIRKRKLWENEVITEEFKTLSQFWKPFDTAADPKFTAYRFSSPELYADFVSVLLNAPAKAKEIAPNGYRAFFNYLEAKPEVMKNLLELQALVQGDDVDLQKVRAGDILEMFERGEDAFRARQIQIEAAKKSTFDRMKLLFFDKNAVILKERDKLAKSERLDPATDAKYAIERNSMMGSIVKSHLEDFDRLIYQPAKDAELMDAVKTMLFLDRVGADREELANPLGHTPETAQELLSAMKQEDPAKFGRATELAQAARDWFRGLAQIPGGQDFFSPEQFSLMAMNDKYAPFRVIDYMRDYVAAGFSQQAGTLKDIGDPLTSLAMKGVSVVTAIERNQAKKIVGQMLLRANIDMRPVEIINFPGVFKIPEPTERHMGTLAWKEQGKWTAFHVDKDIADAINGTATEQMGNVGAAFNLMLGNRVFRNLFIVYNATFQSKNLIKDFMRTWRNSPRLSIAKAMKLYATSLPEAMARAKGTFDPLIQEMERSAALQVTYNDLILGQTSEDTELEAVLEKFDIVKSKTTSFDKTPIVGAGVKILDYLRFIGDSIETLPKVVGWKALDYMNEQERAYMVRNLIGTPNPKRTGTGVPVSNAIFLFSNVYKEGLRGMYEAAISNPTTRGQYWKKMSATVGLKMVMAYAAAGALGIGVQELMNKVSNYNLTNFFVIPLGEDEDGNAIALRLPLDEESRLISALTWKMFNHNGSLTKNLNEVLSPPSLAPLFTIAGVWASFLKGQNPRDDFRGQDILTEDEFAAGGLEAFEPMVRWTINSTGLFKLDIRDRLKDEPLYKPILESIPVLQSYIISTRQGERESFKAKADQVKREEAKRRLAEKDDAREARRSGKTVEQFIDEKNPQTSEDLSRLKREFESVGKGLENDPAVQALQRASSNEQKLAILNKAKERFKDGKEFDNFVSGLVERKVISAKLAVQVGR